MELKPDLAAMMGILFILLGITLLPCFCCMGEWDFVLNSSSFIITFLVPF